jgi:hypothetical protein
MSTANEAHILVIEGQNGLKVQSLEHKRWKQLSLTYRETRLSLDGIPIWVKYQSWIAPDDVTGAAFAWLTECEGVPF